VDALATIATTGFDLAHPFDAAHAARTPGLDRLAGPERLGILVGNTRAAWPAFQAALGDPALAADPDPLDRFTERVITAGFATGTRIYFGHRAYDGTFLPLQRLAALTGLGAVSPSQLVIHPIYGPWIALRAVVLLDGDPPAPRPIAQACTCTAACGDAFARAQRSRDPADWLAVREACALRAHRYSDAQIAYHYGRMRR
jgi:cyanocobalamin reductase (cyanide-eliminating) / alkylcobalamin dealkylase